MTNAAATPPQSQTIANAYERARARDTFEQSEMYRDGNSSYWHSKFLAMAGILYNLLGVGGYAAWCDANFPNDDGIALTWKTKYEKADAEIKKAQAQP